MSHYRSNVRDLEFNLFELFGRGELMGHGPYEAVDVDTAREMIHEVARLAEHELADSLVDSDRNPPVYDPESHQVRMPDSFKASYAAYVRSGFWAVDVPAELDGTVIPPSLKWAINELILGANPAVGMYASSFAFAKLLHILGNDDQKKLARLMVDHAWGATMVLTEPDAGSDVGAGRTRATRTATARGTSPGSSGSSPRPSTTSPTTSSTSCWPDRRVRARAPRGFPCSSSPSSTST